MKSQAKLALSVISTVSL